MFYIQPDNFTINLLGECQFSANDIRQLSVMSRIGFWGCWLTFENKTIKKSFFKFLISKLISPRYFIFKKSLSPKQYSRLCRIILKLNNTTDN
jgi:hypothetical protein